MLHVFYSELLAFLSCHDVSELLVVFSRHDISELLGFRPSRLRHYDLCCLQPGYIPELLAFVAGYDFSQLLAFWPGQLRHHELRCFQFGYLFELVAFWPGLFRSIIHPSLQQLRVAGEHLSVYPCKLHFRYLHI